MAARPPLGRPRSPLRPPAGGFSCPCEQKSTDAHPASPQARLWASARTGHVMTYGEVVFMANIEGLRKTLEYIKEHPEEWDQGRWHMCFAGTSLRVLKGAELTDLDCCNSCRRLKLDGRSLSMHDIGEMAQAVLGLTVEQDVILFAAENTLEDLERIVAEITAEQAVSA